MCILSGLDMCFLVSLDFVVWKFNFNENKDIYNVRKVSFHLHHILLNPSFFF